MIFEPAVELMLAGPGVAPLTHLLEVAATICDCASVAIIARTRDENRFLLTLGLPLARFGLSWPVAARTDFVMGSDGQAVVDPALLARIVRPRGMPEWRWLFAEPIPLPGLSIQLSLVCADTRVCDRAPAIATRMQLLARVMADEMQLIGHLWRVGAIGDAAAAAPAADLDARPIVASQFAFRFADDRGTRRVAEDRVAALTDPDGGDEVVVEFLRKTLIRQTRLIRRTDLGYHAVHRWRAALKQWQILALRSLKARSSPGLVTHVADDLANAATTLFGVGSFGAVAAVPCGSSGPECLAQRTAIAVARRLDLPFVDAFAALPAGGSSHPRRNIARPTMQLTRAPDVPTLLIDDVATSGAHISEATRLLRRSAPMVMPLVWVAP